MNSSRKGDESEAVVVSELMKLGYSVSIPFGDNDRYDLIVDDGNKLQKVQVKTANYKEDKIQFNCYSDTYKNGNRELNHYSEEEIDAYVVYCSETEDCFWVDVEDAPKTKMMIRFSEGYENANSYEDYIMGS